MSVFGNPNCHPSAQNCSAAACCTYNGMCPQDWTVPDTCYYPYYWYNDRITTEIAIGIGATVFVFVAITIAVGVIQWFYKHNKQYQVLKEKKEQKSEVGSQSKEIMEVRQEEIKEEEKKEEQKKEEKIGTNSDENQFSPKDVVHQL